MYSALYAALEYQAQGLAVFPLPLGEKHGCRSWAQYRYVPPDRREITLMFSDSEHNIAVIAGRASRNLVALDCDSPATFTQVSTRLAALGITTWTVRRDPNHTPHDGGGTFVLRTPEPVESAKLDALDILAEGRYFLAPPSLHPGGTRYYSNPPPPPIFTLPTLDALGDWLKLAPAPDPHPRRKIPWLAWSILTGDPQTLSRYHTRSEAEAALCASLICAAFTRQDALRLLRKYGGPGKFAELDADNPRNAVRYLTLTWDNALEWTTAHQSDAPILARRLRAWATSRPWPGRGASSDRAIYLAHLSIVEECAHDPHGASARQLAEMTGMTWQTAANANNRLVNQRLLELVKHATPSCPHVWRLLIPPDLDALERAYFDNQSPSNVMECQSMPASHDAFRWVGLNKSGAEVLEALCASDEATANELAARTGRDPTTVRRKLGQMFTLGLVQPLGDGYWRAADNPDLDRAAIDLGTAGAGARQHAQHVRDRRYNRELLKRGIKP